MSRSLPKNFPMIQENSPLVVLDFITAAVAIAGAVMLALDYFNH